MFKLIRHFFADKSTKPNIFSRNAILILVELEDRRTPSATDLVANSIQWNVAQKGVTVDYSVVGDPLTKNVNGAFYWATGSSFVERLGGPVRQFTLNRAVGDHSVTVTSSMLGSHPQQGAYLLFVVDPNNQVAETDETNNLISLAVPDISVQSITTTDSRSLTVTYTVADSAVDEVPIGFYRSSNNTFGGDKSFAPVANEPGDVGTHTVTINLSQPLAINPSQPFVLVQADPNSIVPELSETNNTATFRTRVLGVVTHGFTLLGALSVSPPSWITSMANSLKSQGYDRTIAYDWTALSNLPISGMVDLAAQGMVHQIDQALDQMKALYPNDVIDVQLIGHSRGADVVSEAASMLQGNSIVEQGTLRLTLLDPHPASNAFGADYSAAPIIGYPFELALIGFQSLANDPPIVISPNVDIVDDYYQMTPWFIAASGSGERILNLWGNVPITDNSAEPVHYDNLTWFGMSHGQVINWYMSHVVPNLHSGQV
jgi:hypothetical protein